MIWARIIYRFGVLLVAFMLLLTLWALGLGQDIPVGQEIAYVSKQNGSTWDIHLMDVERRLSYNLSGLFMPMRVRNRLPTWSPNGDELAFVSEFEARRGMDILIMRLSRPRMWVLANSIQDETMPVWSPLNVGTQRIAFTVFNGLNWDIDVQRVYDDDVVLIQDVDTGPFLEGPASDVMPRWSPDGESLLFASNRGGGRQFDLYLVDAHGRNMRALTRRMDVNDYVEWSPNGTHVAFVSERDANREIYVVNVERGAVSNLTQHGGDDYAPVWSPDGETIAFVSNRDGDEEIYIMGNDGDTLRQMTDNDVYDYAPVWSLDSTAIIYVSEPDFITTELYLVEVATGHTTRLTHNTVDDWSAVWRP